MSKIIISESVAPPLRGCSSLHCWERGLDPWHKDAFLAEFKGHAPNQEERKGGWFGLDGFGNPITFVPDGTEIEE